MIRYVLTIAFLVSSLAASAAEPTVREPSPDQEAATLRAAERIGLAIYRHDQAAGAATDSASKLRPFRKDKRVKGWITEEQQDRIVVTFVDQTPAALYRVTVSKDGIAGPATALGTPATLSPYESGAAAARAAAMASKFQHCSNAYNTVVLPSPDASWVVYLIPATTSNNVVQIGGTYRVDVRGSEAVSQRGFTRTCIALQNDAKAVGLMITHLLDPVPTEAHVFWSLWAGKPMYVATSPSGTVWLVKQGKIELVERKAALDGK